jgi:hypothetical protein
MKVHVLSLVGKFVKTLPHMVRHYQQAGVRSFRIHVHATSEDDPVIAEVRVVLARFGLRIASVLLTPTWIDAQNIIVEEEMDARPDDWFIIVDQDELQGYPADLSEILADCEAHGYDHVHGCLIDRLGPDGTLPPVRDDMPLWEQFPLGSLITHSILQAYPRKIALTKGYVPNNGSGSHWALGGTPCPIERWHIPVYHFKWTDGLVQHLKDRVQILRSVDQHWRESQRAIDYLEQNGRFDVEDPLLLAGPCDPEYRWWPQVTRICGHETPEGGLPELVWADRGTPVGVNAGGIAAGHFRGNLRGHRLQAPRGHTIEIEGISDPAPAAVYAGARAGECAYVFGGLSPGARYVVRLHFVELAFTTSDARHFGARLNGRPCFENFDIHRAAGGRYKAAVKQAEVEADDLGFIFIDLLDGLNSDPIISGIEILDAASPNRRAAIDQTGRFKFAHPEAAAAGKR